MHGLSLLALSVPLAACTSSAAGGAPQDAGSGDAVPASEGGVVAGSVDMPGGASGVGFDDIRFSTDLRRVVSAPGGTGSVDLIDPDALAVVSVSGFDGSVESADEGQGVIFALDRAHSSLNVADPSSKKIVATAPLAAGPDYVRYSPITHEVWVTEPSASQIEVLSLQASGPPTHAAVIAIAGGPEGLAFDVSRQRAYAHLYAGKLIAIDVNQRTVVATWPTGCASSHGIPAIDEKRGFVFAGCADNAKVAVLDLNNDGKQLGSYSLGPGETILAYAPSLGHFYLRGDPGIPVAMLGVSSTGSLSLLGTVNAANYGHCATADDRGFVWVCDANGGRLLRFQDTYPSNAN
jgi:hypothetical protein